MKAHRLERVAEVIREVASETILFEVKDPRIKGVTVTRTEVSGDLQHAKVFVSIMGTEREQDRCLHGLQHAAGFIQGKLGDRLKSRFTPVIRFVLDHGVKNSIEVSRLINEALAQQAPTADDAGEEEPDPE
jgi:ribosome-binding factor A